MKIIQTKEIHIRRFNYHLKESGYSEYTIARKNSSLRLFFKFLRKQGAMNTNPIEDIKQPKIEKREKFWKDEEIKKIEEIIEDQRDLLLFSFLYRDKIRLSKIVTLKLEHYKKEQGILYIPNHEAIVLSEETKRLIEKLKLFNQHDYFFYNKHGKPLTESGAYFILKEYFKKAGLKELRPIDLTF